MRRGTLQQYWSERDMKIAIPVLKAYGEYTDKEYRNDLIGLKHLLSRDSWFEACMATAPMHQKGLSARHVKQLGCAW